ncbi:MAG: PadR family transcriptional regulator, partial [Dehalococcoidia bacterium]
MSLKHALLGILSLEPMTGYEVKRFFDSSVQHFWNAELSQIYPTLKSLEESGFVDMRVEVQQNRPNRKIYAITDDGRAEFERWFRAPQPPADLRDPFLIKVFFGT